MKRLGLLLLFSLVLNLVAVADPITVVGTAHADNDGDQQIHMTVGSGPSLTYANHGEAGTQDCAIGVPCHFTLLFTDAAGPIPGTEEVVLAQMYFDMSSGPELASGAGVQMTGTFSGTLQFATCTLADVAVCGEGAASLRYAAVDQNCGPNQNAACVYSLAGFAEGTTGNSASIFNFAGTAAWVPEPSSLAMLGTGMGGVLLGSFRRKLHPRRS